MVFLDMRSGQLSPALDNCGIYDKFLHCQNRKDNQLFVALRYLLYGFNVVYVVICHFYYLNYFTLMAHRKNAWSKVLSPEELTRRLQFLQDQHSMASPLSLWVAHLPHQTSLHQKTSLWLQGIGHEKQID